MMRLFAVVLVACNAGVPNEAHFGGTVGEPETSAGASTGVGSISTGVHTTSGSTGSTGFDVILDVAPGDIGEENPCPESCLPGLEESAGPWLLHAGDDALMKVDVQTGIGVHLCDLSGPATRFYSITFSADNRLLASTGRHLYEVDTCTCETTLIGEFPFEQAGPMGAEGASIFGITPADDGDLYGISALNDTLVRIDVDDASTVEVGPLGVDLFTHGATSDGAIVYAIRGNANELYAIDPSSGIASLVASITGAQFGTVGLERHPDSGTLYACTDDGILYQLDPSSGVASTIGAMIGVDNACTNLGAPWSDGPGVCIPAG